MSFTGHVKAGVVVFDGPARPPEGAIVRVEEVPGAREQAPTWGEVFSDLVGIVDDLPEDMAENHDDYIHGLTAYPHQSESAGTRSAPATNK
jgi:hypothetical protein